MIFSCTKLNFNKVSQYMLQIVSKLKLLISKIKLFEPEQPRVPTLKEEISKAHQEWVDAKRVFEEITDEQIDYAIFRLNAAERRYMYLLNEAKKTGLGAWEEEYASENGK